jgi:thymidylate synthase (FAD)
MKTAPISVTLIDKCGSDLSVVNAARVSFHKESEWEYDVYYKQDDDEFGRHFGPNIEHKKHDTKRLSSKDAKLINYLAKHEHLSPFNHSFLSFRVKAPIFVARQLVKHKFMPWNEVSRRYVDEEPEFYFPETWRKKAADKKQGSGDVYTGAPPFGNFCELSVYPEELCNITLDLYLDAINKGVCPEQARMILPQNTMTEWIWSGTLGAFCAMLKLRLKEDTQEETRAVASLISKEVERLFPISYGALVNERSV